MSERAKRKTFLLGVGAQKAGTTWLHDYLSEHDNVDLGFRKEYHVFDALSSGGHGFFRSQVQNGKALIEELEERAETKNSLLIIPARRSRPTFKLLDFLYDYNNYFSYFDSLLKQESTFLTGDITPSYSGLSPEIFQVIKNGVTDRGIAVRVLFLMRDPVDRFVSSCQMASGRRRHAIDQGRFENIVRRRYKTENSEDRGRYDQTIQNLEAVFDKSELHYEFYERLFDETSIAKICDFLGIEPRPAKLDNRVNESTRKLPVSDDVKSEIRAHLSPVYDFLYDRYSKPCIDSMWKAYG